MLTAQALIIRQTFSPNLAVSLNAAMESDFVRKMGKQF